MSIVERKIATKLPEIVAYLTIKEILQVYGITNQVFQQFRKKYWAPFNVPEMRKWYIMGYILRHWETSDAEIVKEFKIHLKWVRLLRSKMDLPKRGGDHNSSEYRQSFTESHPCDKNKLYCHLCDYRNRYCPFGGER